MAVIKSEIFIDSIAQALQFISYYHPQDFIDALYHAYQREQSAAAKEAIAQILINSRLAAENHRPICQDTGIVNVFLKVGMNVRWESNISLEAMVNEGVHRAYNDIHNPLRASIVSDPLGTRKNTGDNSPAVIHTELVQGNEIEVTVAAKGFGSEMKAKFAMLTPHESLVDWVVKQVPTMGAGWCPPGILGIGVGGTSEHALLLAKKSLMQPINIQELYARGPSNRLEKLRLEIYEKVNQLGIGAQGLGGLTTVLDVKILDYPTHSAGLPVAIIPNCAATRHIHFKLGQEEDVDYFKPPRFDHLKNIKLPVNENIIRVNTASLGKEQIKKWRVGDRILLSGRLLTARDAAHKRIAQLVQNNQPLPVDLTDSFIYYVGPVAAVGDEIVGPAGPTTATRMDKYTDMMLNLGVLGMIGKAERGSEAIQSIKDHGAVYLIAVGGAAYLISKAIKAEKVIAFEDLGMEAIYEFLVEDLPLRVAVDSDGNSLHERGPREWQGKIKQFPINIKSI